MLRIRRNQSNNLIVTVGELTTLTAPVYYLFEFIEEQSDQREYCILEDVSTGPIRYNEFTFIEGTDASLPYAGFYTYKIYQQASDVNLDPSLSSGIVEEGRAYVYDAESPASDYTPSVTDYIYE